MPFGIGPLEIVIVLALALLVFGPRRLPGMGRGLGSAMREFGDGIKGVTTRPEGPALPAADAEAGRVAEADAKAPPG